MKYFDEVKRSMEMLSEDPQVVFMGQAVAYPGTAMYQTLKDTDMAKRIECPVAEEMQMGMSIGLSLEGHIPVCIFPRWNFLLCAANQLINHLDKLPMCDYHPGVIVRVGIGSERPLHPQHQHVGDFTDAFKSMLKNISVIRLDEPEQIFPAYQVALKEARAGVSTIIVENADFYNEK